MKKRDQKYTLNEYDIIKWPTVINLLKKQIESGDLDLTRNLNLINKVFRNKNSREFIDIIMNNNKINISLDFAISGNQSFICKKIIQNCKKNTKAIVEIGSGYGRNLFWTWLYGGPSNIKYYGLEFTKSGKDAADILSSFERKINFSSIDFDYYAPNFDFLNPIDGHIVFVTVHSIEQIPKLKKIFFEKLLNLENDFDCIHFEPIGWQIRKNTKGTGTSKEYAFLNDYNTNFYNLIKEFEKNNLIEIQEKLIDFICINPENGTSVLSWKKV